MSALVNLTDDYVYLCTEKIKEASGQNNTAVANAFKGCLRSVQQAVDLLMKLGEVLETVLYDSH